MICPPEKNSLDNLHNGPIFAIIFLRIHENKALELSFLEEENLIYIHYYFILLSWSFPRFLTESQNPERNP